MTGLVPYRSARVRLGLAVLLCCLADGAALAFPLTDEANPGTVPMGAPLAAPDVAALQHQMGLVSGFGAIGPAQGWTILPRFSMEEQFTDNVDEVAAPRRWDLTTIVAPGVAILGDTPRVQLRLDYEPDLSIHVENGSQNLLAQQFNGVGTLTVVPDMVFIDLRALAGTQAINGGIGGIGGLGQSGIGGVTGASLVGGPDNEVGLSKQNRSETTSVSISPYMLYSFGDLGTGRLGASLSRTSSSQLSGFAPLPLVSQGIAPQTQTAAEEFASFATGNQFARVRDTFTADGMQIQSSGVGTTGSTRDFASDRVDYQINRSFDVYGQLGREYINYSGSNGLTISDMTWGFGTVLTPSPDLTLTIGYGHQDGANSVNASGVYALTARTTLTGSYTSGVGTQLEQVQRQLNQAAVANNGTLVNSQTGAPLFVANNALGVAPGIYRYTDLTLSLSSVLNRDTFTLTVARSQETQLGNGIASSTNGVTTANLVWTHQLNEALVANAATSYSIGTPTAGNNSNSFLAALSVQYILSASVSTFASYDFYGVSSSAPGASWYQDVVLVGITKQF